MRIDIAKIMTKPDNSSDIQTDLSFDQLEFMDTVHKVTNLSGVDVTINSIGNKRVHIVLKTAVRLNFSCNRCLCDVPVDFNIDFEDDIRINDSGKGITQDDEETNYIDEFELDTDRLIEEELLLMMPSKVLCKDDCKGLCPVCGINLNKESCNCDTVVLDPRMAKIRDIFNNYKEV